MTHVAMFEDRSWWRPAAATSWQSSTSYCAAKLCRQKCKLKPDTLVILVNWQPM